MTDVEVTLDAAAIRLMGDLRTAVKQLPYAAARSLTGLAWGARQDYQAEAKTAFDRPKPWTLSAVSYTPATKTHLSSSIQMQSGSRPEHDIGHEFTGGTRAHKAFEVALTKAGALPGGWYAIPAPGTPLDRYGNVSRALINKIKAGLGITAGKGKAKRKTVKYLVARPGQMALRGAHPGIYATDGIDLQAVLLFVPRLKAYQQRIDLPKVGQRAYQQRFDRLFTVNLAKACGLFR